LATMRTVRNIWRQEDQKRNVLEIAKQSGALYDKFVGFVEDLSQIGVKLRQTQDAYDAAHNKLTSGKGNLITRAEQVLKLGAKASKRLPLTLFDSPSTDESLAEESIEETTESLPFNEGDLLIDTSTESIVSNEEVAIPAGAGDA
jgi:DNA recombination protein RmuC